MRSRVWDHAHCSLDLGSLSPCSLSVLNRLSVKCEELSKASLHGIFTAKSYQLQEDTQQSTDIRETHNCSVMQTTNVSTIREVNR